MVRNGWVGGSRPNPAVSRGNFALLSLGNSSSVPQSDLSSLGAECMHVRIVCLLILLSGCSGSRWARKDFQYAAKYNKHSDNAFQMVKQASDARFQKGRSGFRLGAEYGHSPATLGGSLGVFGFPKSWLELHCGLDGLVGTGHESLYGGLGTGVRIHSPTRFSVFGGLGGQVVGGERDLSWDGRDNNRNALIDEPEEEDISSFYAAVLPEVGFHFWLTPWRRLTAHARYSISTSGRADDQWLFGFSVSKVDEPQREEIECDEYRVSDQAHAGLDQIHADTSAKHDARVASQAIDDIYDSFESLLKNPHRGERKEKNLFEYATANGPMIEYRKIKEGIEIVRVAHRDGFQTTLNE